MNRELSPLDNAALDLLEQARQARDQRLFDSAKVAFDREKAAEASVSTEALVYNEALALSRKIIELNKRGSYRFLGRNALGISRRSFAGNRLANARIDYLCTPVLFPIQKELLGDQEVTHGWRFDAMIQSNPNVARKARTQPIVLEICNVTQELSEELESFTVEYSIPLFEAQEGKAQFESSLVSVDVDDAFKELREAIDRLKEESPIYEEELFNQFALLHMARVELGDKTAL